MRKIKLIFVLILIGVSFMGCQYSTKKMDMVICGSYGVPGMFCNEIKGNHYDCQIIEEDIYGRTLFSYSAENIITEQKETALIICQASDEKYVYYYENICYLLDDWTESDVAMLKNLNDWNLELDYNKMATRTKQISFDLVLLIEADLEYNRVKAICCDEFDIVDSQITELCFLDNNSATGYVLYWFTFRHKESVEKYYVIVNSDYDITYSCVTDLPFSQETITSLKQSALWWGKGDGSLS